ncbi:hypothetical protein AAZV13_19G184700 [Glycine max]
MMIQKMFDSTRSGMTRSSSHVASINDNDFLELVWENGEIVVRGGSSSNRSRKTNEERIHEDASINKRTRLNPLYSLEDHFLPQRDSDMSSSHQSNNGQDSCQSSQSKNSCKLHEEFANLLKPVTTGNSHLQQCLPSSPLKKQRTDSTQTPRPAKVNFSNFSIPAVFLKSTTTTTTNNYQGNSATQQTKNHSSPARVEEIEALKVDKSAKETQCFQKQTSLTVERSTKLPTPAVDEHSEAAGHNCGVLGIHRSQGQTSTSEALRAKAKAYNNNNINMCHEPLLASSSVCSLGASNDPNLGFRKHEDTDDSTYLSDNDGEPEDMVKQDREGNRVKRSRNPEVHNLSEKKRREKINKKMRTLKDLIPNCNKVDKASMLDDAIDYLKTLKLQLQIMSMGSGLWPLMMGFRPPQLPIPPLSAITDNRLIQMFGSPNQIPPMPMPHAPFFPIIGNSATQSHLANNTTTTAAATTNLAEHLANSLHGNATKLAPPSQISFQHHHTSTSTPTLATPFIFPQK